ncbi:hypothetical protein R3751_07615 [Halorubrum distributum]|uniref:hypothetical protein n=1 Tax=Halorubrum distributum TaxID=29283 RepID=UPI0029550F46|nr:hypothetical protein [Halorubrum distributum]MDV7349642.1 hypothetical protein [Halorubrum distributum]
MGVTLLCSLSASIYLSDRQITFDKNISLLMILIGVYILSGAFSGLIGPGNERILIGTARYTAVILLLLLGGANFIISRFRDFSLMILLIFTGISLLGLFSVIIGTYSLGPIAVTQYYPIRIRSYEIPTSSSILWNTNYYAICLLISLCIIMPNDTNLFSNWKIKGLAVAPLLTSIILTRSRSAWVTSVIILGISIPLTHYNSLKNLQLYIRNNVSLSTVVIYSSLIISAVIYTTHALSLYAILYDLLLGRGLNNRYELYVSALESFLNTPEGYGFGGVSDAMIDAGASTTTTQNSYFAILLMGSVSGLASYTLIIVAGVRNHISHIYNSQRNRKNIHVSMLLITLVVSLDGFWRTYMFGGAGFIPFMFTLAVISSVIHNDCVKIQSEKDMR